MVYTKEQLIAAFCASKNVEQEDLPAIQIEIEARLDAQRVKIQTRLDNLPTAKQRMKSIALQYLSKEARQQSISDNESINL